MEFAFGVAGPEDDVELRKLLAETAMPGLITVTFEREPDYFLGCTTMGDPCQVLIARHVPDGELSGVLCRAIRRLWINGQVTSMGYVGQIRVAEKYRGRRLLKQWMPHIQAQHHDGRVRHYFGVISDENTISRSILMDKQYAGFPGATEVARIKTLGLILRRPKATVQASFKITRGTSDQLPQIAAFLQEHGPHKQLFPFYDASNLTGPAMRGFELGDLAIAWQDGVIVGVVGLWDQGRYKQTVVQRYNGYLRWARPFYNLGSRVFGVQPLPAEGQYLASPYASMICIANNDPVIFRVLIREVYNTAAARQYPYLMVGLTEGDPLLEVAQEYAHITYQSRLYVGGWDEPLALDDRVPYVEIATL